MAQSITDQLLEKGLVGEGETPEAQRAAARDARPVEPDKKLPPAFEAPARGVMVSSSSAAPIAVRRCADCGATLHSSHRAKLRCAECAADAD
jgi:hypothetical protein